MWAHRFGSICHAQVRLLDCAPHGLGTGITNGEMEKGTQAEYDDKIPAYVGNIGRFEGGQVKAMLERFLESICNREEGFGKNEVIEQV